MGTVGRFKTSDTERVLRECLGDFEKEVKDHRIRYKANGRLFPSFPKCEHGKRDPEHEKGHVKKLFRELGVDPE